MSKKPVVKPTVGSGSPLKMDRLPCVRFGQYVIEWFEDFVPNTSSDQIELAKACLSALVRRIREGESTFHKSTEDGFAELGTIEHEYFTPDGLNERQIALLRTKAKQVLRRHLDRNAQLEQQGKPPRSLRFAVERYDNTDPRLRIFGFFYSDESDSEGRPVIEFQIVLAALID